MAFPPNPSDGMLYEPEAGTYYKYSASTKTWTKLEGLDQFSSLATPLLDGLMSSDDYNKIYGLLIPPPRTTLRSEQCDDDIIFNTGTYGFRSSNEDLFIESDLTLMNTDMDKNVLAEQKEVFQIHENTYGISFKVNVKQLMNELISRGQLTYHKSIGPQGPQGPKGKNGIDNIDAGPRGEKGESGKNAPWNGTLVSGSGETEPGRGIVDITTEQVSPTENYLVVTRANIQNTAYCPSEVKPVMQRSPWVVAVGGLSSVKRDCKIVDPCNTCNLDVAIPFCASNLYYIDMTDIEDAIRNRFLELLAEMKAAKETVVNQWLQLLMQSFYDNKAALCCAIENCTSRAENKQARERIDHMKVLAAQADKQLVVAPVTSGRRFPRCEEGANNPLERNINLSNVVAIINLDASKNYSADNPAVFQLDPGEYIFEITNCCYQNLKTKKYNGAVMVSYDNDVKFLAHYKEFDNLNNAISEYVGLTYNIEIKGDTQTGNTVKMWMPVDQYSSGNLQVSIRTKNALPIMPGKVIEPEVFSCNVSSTILNKYEEAWNSENCIGTLVELNGNKWIIVKRPDDTSPCVNESKNAGFHPSIACKTVDGKHFSGVPQGMVRLVRNMKMESEVMVMISENKTIISKGEPLNHFEGILFLNP